MSATAPSDWPALHPLAAADAARGLALSAGIGWNQALADWEHMLGEGSGHGRSDGAGRLVATAMALPYGTFGWVCMVLVAEDWRRRGIATDMMGRVIADLERAGVVPGLDATPAGREVYRPLGFVEDRALERLVADAPDCRAEPPRDVEIRPLGAPGLAAVAAHDRPVFGADRARLLARLRARAPERAFVARSGGRVRGYALARDGRRWTQVGPVVADDAAVARSLIARAAAAGGPLLVDAAAWQEETLAWLKRAGFSFQRPYHRMYRGARPPGDAARLHAVAGPELG